MQCVPSQGSRAKRNCEEEAEELIAGVLNMSVVLPRLVEFGKKECVGATCSASDTYPHSSLTQREEGYSLTSLKCRRTRDQESERPTWRLHIGTSRVTQLRGDLGWVAVFASGHWLDGPQGLGG